jgi:hypothetical protein
MIDFKDLEVRTQYAEDVLMKVFSELYKQASQGDRGRLGTCFTYTFGDRISVYSGDYPMYMRDRFERMASTIKENELTGFDPIDDI